MRLLMTTDTVGGVWTFTRELAGGLLGHGCEIVLVAFGGAASARQQVMVDELTLCGRFRYVAGEAPLEWMPGNELAYTAAEALLLQICCDFNPNALLLSQFCFGALPVAMPKLVVAHSDVLGWAAAVGKAPLDEDAWLRQYRELVQRGLDGTDRLLAPTEAALSAMRPFFRLPSRTDVVANGRTLASQPHRNSRQVRAVTAGRMWDPAKNLAVLTKMALPLPVLVAGECSVSEKSGVTMLGQQNESDLMELFQQSAIYLCCSKYEPFGLAALEAALCGCAVLANDIPTLREVWGDAALYFTDAASLCLLLAQLVANESLLFDAQTRSGERAATYTAARMTRGYLQHITAAIAERGGETLAA